MPKGHSLHIGLNKVDQKHYDGLPELKSAVKDAKTMSEFAKAYGYESLEPLLDDKATAEMVLTSLDEYAETLQPGDILLITYSGHGGQIDDPEFYTTRDKGADETWCLYDRQLIDDELFEAFLKFREGVRILVMSDSCHSGTMTRDELDPVEKALLKSLKALENEGIVRSKTTKDGAAYANNKEIYRPILQRLKKNTLANRRVKASVKLLAACQDSEVAYDEAENGRFTGTFRALMGRENMIENDTSADKLLKLIKNESTFPTPNLLDYGGIIESFDRYFPFIIDIPSPESVAGYRTPPNEEPEQFAWKNLTVNDGPPTPKPKELSVSIEFFDGDNQMDALLPLLPDGVKAIRFQRKNAFVVDFKEGKYASTWDAIHPILERADAAGISLEAEPAQTKPTPVSDDETSTKAGGFTFDPLEKWPPVSTNAVTSFAWHLEDNYSQLASARDRVMAGLENQTLTKRVRIAHFDTGYFPSHPAILPNVHILRDLARSFVPGETTNKALDIFYGDGEVQGHGLGTLALLAGWKMKPEDTDGVYSDYFGAAPCAEVIPMRIGDGVIIMDSEAFVDAVDYAIEQNCEVITMSRGGKPSLKMARAVNKAYEAGIVIVTAAGNSIVGGTGFDKFGPRTVVWPARFPRVIAACGICQNQYPYDIDAQKNLAHTRGFDSNWMQGNWGPKSAMNYAMAAYTPNVPWALYRRSRYFSMDGGGTSSATPQIAAAAALYIMQHRKALEDKGYYEKGQLWKKAEAVRRALFEGAYLDPHTPELNPYYGRGILKAMQTLNVDVMEITDDMKAPEAESSWFGWSEAVGLFLKRRRDMKSAGASLQHAIALEIAHVLMTDPALADLYDRLSFEGTDWPAPLMDEVAGAIKASPFCSEALRKEL